MKGRRIHLGNNSLRKEFTPLATTDGLCSLFTKNVKQELGHFRAMVSDDRRRTIYNVIPSTTFGPLVKGKDISLVIEDYPDGIGEKFGIPSHNTKDLSEIGGGIKSLN